MGPNRRMLARVGTLVRGKWRIDEFISRGSMAAVYSATHRNGTKVALKILHEAYAKDEALTQRFLREGYMANSVEHPGTVKVVDDDVTEDGCAFLVMELLRGETLEEKRRKANGTIPIGDVLAWGDQLLAVLEAAHDKGVIHRDLKPENVFLTTTGEIKVLDWGVAQQWDGQTSSEMTSTGMVLGTPAFMPPEQALGKRDEVDHTSDLWAVGATLFTLLAGEAVHPGTDAIAKLVATAKNPARLLRSVAPRVPMSVALVIDRALSFKRADRFPSASAMREALLQANPLRDRAAVPDPDEVTVVNVGVDDVSRSLRSSARAADLSQSTSTTNPSENFRSTAPLGMALPKLAASTSSFTTTTVDEPPPSFLAEDEGSDDDEGVTERRDVPSDREPSTERRSPPSARQPHPSAAFALPLAGARPSLRRVTPPPTLTRSAPMPVPSDVRSAPAPAPTAPSSAPSSLSQRAAPAPHAFPSTGQSNPPVSQPHATTSAPPPHYSGRPHAAYSGSPPRISEVPLPRLSRTAPPPPSKTPRAVGLVLAFLVAGVASFLGLRHFKQGPFAPRPIVTLVDAGAPLSSEDASALAVGTDARGDDASAAMVEPDVDASVNAALADAGLAADASAPSAPKPTTAAPRPSSRPVVVPATEPLPTQIPSPLPTALPKAATTPGDSDP